METFDLEKQEYIELNRLLKVFNMVASGGEAKHLIKGGNVLVNGEVEVQVRKKLRAGDKVDFKGQQVKIIAT